MCTYIHSQFPRHSGWVALAQCAVWALIKRVVYLRLAIPLVGMDRSTEMELAFFAFPHSRKDLWFSWKSGFSSNTFCLGSEMEWGDTLFYFKMGFRLCFLCGLPVRNVDALWLMYNLQQYDIDVNVSLVVGREEDSGTFHSGSRAFISPALMFRAIHNCRSPQSTSNLISPWLESAWGCGGQGGWWGSAGWDGGILFGWRMA